MNEQDRKKLLETVGVAQYKATKQRLRDGVKTDSERMAEIWDTPPIPTMVEIDLTDEMVNRELARRVVNMLPHELAARYHDGDKGVATTIDRVIAAILESIGTETQWAVDNGEFDD